MPPQVTVNKPIGGGNYDAVVEFDGIPLINKKGTIASIAKKVLTYSAS